MPIGPVRFFVDMRRCTTPLRTSNDQHRVLAILVHDSLKASGSERLGRDQVNFCWGITPIITTRAVHRFAKDRRDRDVMFLAVALELDFDRAAAAVLGDSWNLICGVHRLAVDRDNDIALFEPRFFGGKPGFDFDRAESAPRSSQPAIPDADRSFRMGVTVVSKRLPLRSMVRCIVR